MDETRTIALEQNIKKTIISKLPSKKRAITNTNKWIMNEINSSYEHQLQYLQNIFEDNTENNSTQCSLIIQNINQKINGYRHQDELKNKYDINKFINFKYVICLLIESNLQCYYCKNEIKLLYEFIREPTQWSLDRIDNNFGHNFENLFVTCLSCNLKRRTMYHERYAFTKQLKIDKIN